MSAKKKFILPREVLVHTDGASRGNPGPAALGFIITSKAGESLVQVGRRIGEQTNNFAEYMAVVEALRVCVEGGAKSVVLRSDSELLIQQMVGEYQVNSESLAVLHQLVKKMLPFFEKIQFEHVAREKNVLADKLANQALDKK